MLIEDTRIEDYTAEFGLLVKREDLCCPGGPHFSKTRGVLAHVRNRPESIIGVLDTYHSQAGHAVAAACKRLGKRCVNFYPEYKKEPGHREPQKRAELEGAELVPLPAGRSAILFHRARRHMEQFEDSYMMPNALKLPEMIEETAAEVAVTLNRHQGVGAFAADWPVLIPISSGTIAAGVIKGFSDAGVRPQFILHQGYDRPADATWRYMVKMGCPPEARDSVTFVNQGYSYKAKAKPGETPPWRCNAYYDLKAFRWWRGEGQSRWGRALMWNIG